MIYIPIIGALAQASSTIIEKIVLRIKKVNPKLYQTSAFFGVILVMLPLLYFFWKFEPEALELKNIIIFFSVVIISTIANGFYFYSLKWEKVSNLEPVRLLEPLFVIIIAFIFSFIISPVLYERNSNIIIPALIAAIALIFSHIKKHHLDFNKYFTAAIIGSFLFAFELVLSKTILNYYSPVSFYFLRCYFIFLLSLAVFKPNFNKLNKKLKFQIILAATLWVLFRISVYYGYLNLGVIKTTLILMFSPVFLYILARVFLKEKLSWRNIVASVIIIGCIIYVTLF